MLETGIYTDADIKVLDYTKPNMLGTFPVMAILDDLHDCYQGNWDEREGKFNALPENQTYKPKIHRKTKKW